MQRAALKALAAWAGSHDGHPKTAPAQWGLGGRMWSVEDEGGDAASHRPAVACSQPCARSPSLWRQSGLWKLSSFRQLNALPLALGRPVGAHGRGQQLHHEVAVGAAGKI